MRGKTYRDLKGSMKKLNTLCSVFVVHSISYITSIVNILLDIFHPT